MMKRLALIFALMLFAILLSRISFPFNLISGQYPDCPKTDPQRPSVLLIGDSTQIRYYPLVKKALEGIANVCRIVELAPQRLHSLVYGGPLIQPVNARTTSIGKERLDEWLGDKHWAVIHFNWGIHDLSRTKVAFLEQQAAGSIIRTYASDLNILIERLKQTGAQLVIATTTPVPIELGYAPGMTEAFNEVVFTIAMENDILVNDLYSVVFPRLAELQHSKDVHFNKRGTEILAAETVSSILAALTPDNQRVR